MRTYFAVDPGDAHCGFAWFELSSPAEDVSHQCDCFDHSSDLRLSLVRCLNFTPDALVSYLDTNLRRAHHLIIERFRLYPWMARQQGFSEFHTAELIGVLKDRARRHQIPFTLQDAQGNKKDGRSFASQWGFKMKDRKLGSGRYVYYGPDFDLPGPPHRRDAAAHACSYLGSKGLYSP